jgi:hypothetical protein
LDTFDQKADSRHKTRFDFGRQERLRLLPRRESLTTRAVIPTTGARPIDSSPTTASHGLTVYWLFRLIGYTVRWPDRSPCAPVRGKGRARSIIDTKTFAMKSSEQAAR